MEENRFEQIKNELSSRHLISYSEHATSEDASRIDRMVALYELVKAELELDLKPAVDYLASSEYSFLIQYELKLASFKSSSKGQYQAELYSVLPLFLLWDDIRELRTERDGEVWLKEALNIALSRAEVHDDDSCVFDDFQSASYGCDISPLCPARAVTRLLITQAFSSVDDAAESFVGPDQALRVVDLQLEIAVDAGLITTSQMESLKEQYRSQRPEIA